MEELQQKAIEVCQYRELKLALQYFKIDDPTAADECDNDMSEQCQEKFQSLQALQCQNDWVEDKKIKLIAHDRTMQEFQYWGQFSKYENEPHGIGLAICNNMKEYCYIGYWRNGQLNGYGQKFVNSQWDKSVYIGYFTGTQMERKGPQQDLHYRLVQGHKIVIKRFIESSSQFYISSSNVFQQCYHSERQTDEQWWHLPRSIKTEYKGMQNPDPRDTQSCGKFTVTRDGELWEDRILENAMNRVEKVECTESTRKIELRHSIQQENFERVIDSAGPSHIQNEMNKQIEISLIGKEIPQGMNRPKHVLLGAMMGRSLD